MEKKRILFLISRFLDGGIDTALTEVLKMLAADTRYEAALAVGVKMEGLEVYRDRLPQGVAVHYLVDTPLLCRPKVRRFHGCASRLEKVADELLVNPVRRIIQAHRLKKLVAASDVVVDFDACHTAFLRHCPKPTVAWIHFSLQKLLEQNRRRTLRIVRRLTHYSRVVLICKAMQDEADRLFPELKGKTTFIYNALNVDGVRQCAAAPFDTPPFPYIVAVERLEESQKDITTLLLAYSKLRVAEHLVIVGKGRDEKRLKEYATSLGLTVSDSMDSAARVHFVGFQSNPHVWMAGARLLVHSAKFEGLPTVMVEALMLGLPIVATDCPTGPREILAGGKAGFLTPVGDADAMRRAIMLLLVDRQLCAEVGAQASAHSRCFTSEALKPALDRLLDAEII